MDTTIDFVWLHVMMADLAEILPDLLQSAICMCSDYIYIYIYMSNISKVWLRGFQNWLMEVPSGISNNDQPPWSIGFLKSMEHSQRPSKQPQLTGINCLTTVWRVYDLSSEWFENRAFRLVDRCSFVFANDNCYWLK